jgi:hypothetical protein
MIRVTLELVSANDASRDRLLGVCYIANTGREAPHAEPGTNRYSYDVWLSKNLPGRTREVWKTGRAAIVDDDMRAGCVIGEVPDFNNVKRGAWDLLYCALRTVIGDRNPIGGTTTPRRRRP